MSSPGRNSSILELFRAPNISSNIATDPLYLFIGLISVLVLYFGY